jgi:putative sugar O-methyltransferase
MLALPEEYYARLRLHTYHLTVDTYHSYLLSEAEKAEFFRQRGLQELTRGIPSDLVLQEPPGGIGLMLQDGRFVSNDTVKFQRTVNTLYREGILDVLRPPVNASRPIVLEIGPGYGGLAHHLSNILGNTTYVLIDLPEVLLFSASYLTLLHDTKKIYVYNQADFHSFIDSSEARSYDFIFIPNYRLEALRQWKFDLVLNMYSFQEMTEEQVVGYLDFIRDNCEGVLYSLNADAHRYNRQLSSLTDLLAGC